MNGKKKKIRTSFALITCVGIVVTALVVLLISYTQMAALTDVAVQSNVEDDMYRIEAEIESYKSDAENQVVSLAKYAPFVKAFKTGEPDTIKAAVDDFQEVAFLTSNNVVVTDDSGVVVVRYAEDQKGDNISNLPYVQRCLKGETVTAISKGAVIQLGALSGAPIKDEDGKVIGVVSLTFDLADEKFLDDIKGNTTNEYTIFLDNVRLNTTLMNGGKRAVGEEMPKEVQEDVLKQRKQYFGTYNLQGTDYKCSFKCLTNVDDEVIGAFFAGISMEEIESKRTTAIVMIIVISIVVAVGVIILMSVFTTKAIVVPVTELARVADEMSKGHLSHEIKHVPNNEIGTLAEALKLTLSNLKLYIGDISEGLGQIADGDMTYEVTHDYVGDFASIKDSINKITKHLNSTLTSISTAAEQVNSGAEQVATAAQSLSQGATEQASSIEQLTSSIMSVSEQVNQNAKNVQVAGNYVQESKNGIQSSNTSMGNMVNAMNDINESSTEISKIIKVIDDIAFQTNILALNAAVEAARAGAAGKGFSVVADEVRNLAGKSAEAAKQTTRLIEGSVQSVQKGSAIAEETAKALEAVNEQSEMVVETIKKIQEASNQQAEAINQITIGLEQISSVVQTNSATSEESAAASEELSGQAQMLHKELEQFKLSNAPRTSYSAPAQHHTSAPSAPEPAPVYHDTPSYDEPITINLDDDKY